MIDIAFDKQQVDIINKYIKDIGLRSGKDLSKAIKEGWASGDIESILKNSFDDLLAQTNKDMSKNLTETVFKQYDGFAKELRGKKFSLAGVDLDKNELAQLKKDVRGTLSIDPNAIGIDSLMEEIKDINYDDVKNDIGSIGRKFQTDIINPLINGIGGAELGGSLKIYGGQEILYGHFISSIINFILMAFVLFLLLKFVNKLFSLTVKKEEEKKEEPKKEEPPKKSDEVLLLEEIRDLLKKNAK